MTATFSDGKTVTVFTHKDFLGMLGTGHLFVGLIKTLDILSFVPYTYKQFLEVTKDLRHLVSYSDRELENTYRTLVDMSHGKYVSMFATSYAALLAVQEARKKAFLQNKQ